MASHQVATNTSDPTVNDANNADTANANANTTTTAVATATSTTTTSANGATVEPTSSAPVASTVEATTATATATAKVGDDDAVQTQKQDIDGDLDSKEDASLLAVGTKNELPLQFRWALWYSAPKTADAETAHKWDTERAKQIVEFGSVEEFWRVFNNLTPPSNLSSGSDLQLFRAGVQPAWEDPFNAKGGSWTVKVGKDNKNKFDTIWFNTVLTMIGDNFDDADDICGITVSARPKYNRMQLWTRYADGMFDI